MEEEEASPGQVQCQIPSVQVTPQLAVQEDFDLSPLSESSHDRPCSSKQFDPDLEPAASNYPSTIHRSKSKESIDSVKCCLTETEFSDWTENSLAGDVLNELDASYRHPAPLESSKKSRLPQLKMPSSGHPQKKTESKPEPLKPFVHIPIVDDFKFADDGADQAPELPTTGPPDSPTEPTVTFVFDFIEIAEKKRKRKRFS